MAHSSTYGNFQVSGSTCSLSGGVWGNYGESSCGLISHEVKLAVEEALERFRMNEELLELHFPKTLTSDERKFVHRHCQKVGGLKTKSRGSGANRFLTVTKTGRTVISSRKGGGPTVTLDLTEESRDRIRLLMQNNPVTSGEKDDVRRDRGKKLEQKVRVVGPRGTVPQMPPLKGKSNLREFAESLPVSAFRQQIVSAIVANRVVLVSGETGSGKTTQVPQMILDDCHQRGVPCMMFCTQPRRISAISVSERVAAERNERIGQTVGYHIRLESKVSSSTLLTFCTNGVLLRKLMSHNDALIDVTHIFVDEVHERDRYSDFLLIALREALPRYENLKIVVMSAALNVELFTRYFDDCPAIDVPGKLFDVEEYFLEDVLRWTNYTSKEMEKAKSLLNKGSNRSKGKTDNVKAKEATEKEELGDIKGGVTEKGGQSLDVNQELSLMATAKKKKVPTATLR